MIVLFQIQWYGVSTCLYLSLQHGSSSAGALSFTYSHPLAPSHQRHYELPSSLSSLPLSTLNLLNSLIFQQSCASPESPG
jgi:hypothetical protein